MPISSTSADAPITRHAMAKADCAVSLLGFRARVIGPGDLVEEVRSLFPRVPSWAALLPGCADSAATCFVIRGGVPPGQYQIAQDGWPRWATPWREEVAPFVEWAICAAAVEHLGPRYLLFHAGAVAYGDTGMILPAPSGSGKTTLTAALLTAGFRYVSDEVAAVARDTQLLFPFARSLCIKQGASRALSALYPGLLAHFPRRRPGDEYAWYLPPSEGAWIAAPTPVRYIVFPGYVPGDRTQLTPIVRGDALTELLAQAFTPGARLDAQGMRGIVALLQGAACFRLSVGDVRQARDALLGLVRA